MLIFHFLASSPTRPSSLASNVSQAPQYKPQYVSYLKAKA